MAKDNARDGAPDNEEILPVAPGHDVAALGPSDTSDSGSDVAGLSRLANFDPTVPVDVALDADRGRPGTAVEAVKPGADTDASGTGERRSVADDADAEEATDLLPDIIVDEKGRVLEDETPVDADDLVDRRGEDSGPDPDRGL